VDRGDRKTLISDVTSSGQSWIAAPLTHNLGTPTAGGIFPCFRLGVSAIAGTATRDPRTLMVGKLVLQTPSDVFLRPDTAH
jgi:hypothetical protein